MIHPRTPTGSKDLVKAVQDQIGIVARDLDEIVGTALSEVEKAKASTTNLLTIENDIAVVETRTQEILAASSGNDHRSLAR